MWLSIMYLDETSIGRQSLTLPYNGGCSYLLLITRDIVS